MDRKVRFGLNILYKLLADKYPSLAQNYLPFVPIAVDGRNPNACRYTISWKSSIVIGAYQDNDFYVVVERPEGGTFATFEEAIQSCDSILAEWNEEASQFTPEIKKKHARAFREKAWRFISTWNQATYDYLGSEDEIERAKMSAIISGVEDFARCIAIVDLAVEKLA